MYYSMSINDTCLLARNDSDCSSGVGWGLIAIRTVYISSISLAIIACNALTLAVLWRVRGDFPPGSTKIVMCSLALSDLTVGVMGTFFIPLSVMDRWPFGDVQWPCTVLCSAVVLVTGISVLSLTTLTFDRFVAITRPFTYATLLSKNRVLGITLFQWISSIILVGVVMATVKPDLNYNTTAAMCLIQNSIDVLWIDLMYLCLMFILPMTIMICIYTKLIYTTHQQAKKINIVNTVSSSGTGHGSKPSSSRAGSGKAVRLFCTIVVCYTVSYLPFCSSRVYADLYPGSIPPLVEFVCVWLAVNNSLCNFVIYIVMNKTFRKLSKEILSELFRR